MEEKVFSDLRDFQMINYEVHMHKATIALNEISARVSTKYDTKNKAETQSKTLEYLLPLLQSGKIKVSVGTAIRVKKGVFGFENKVIYDKPEQAEQAIEDIRTRWASYKVKEDIIHDMINASEEDGDALTLRDDFEQFGVLFALPESGCF